MRCFRSDWFFSVLELDAFFLFPNFYIDHRESIEWFHRDFVHMWDNGKLSLSQHTRTQSHRDETFEQLTRTALARGPFHKAFSSTPHFRYVCVCVRLTNKILSSRSALLFSRSRTVLQPRGGWETTLSPMQWNEMYWIELNWLETGGVPRRSW